MRLRRPRISLFFCLAGLMALLRPASALAGPAPDDLLRLLPDDTRVVLYVRDVPGLLAKWRGSPMGQAFESSRNGSFFGPLRGRLKVLRGLLVDEDGLDGARLDAFFNGRWLLAGLPAPAGSPSPIVWVLIFDHNNDPAVLARFRSGGERVQRTAMESGGYKYERLRVAEEVASGIPVSGAVGGPGALASGTAAEGDVRRQAVRETDQYFGDHLAILALAEGDPIQRVLARLVKPADGPSLAGRTDRLRVAGGLPADGDIDVYADTAGLADWFVAHPRPELAWLNLAALRLGETRAAGAVVRFGQGRFEAEASLYAPAPRQGAARLLFGDGAALDPAEDDGTLSRAVGLVPADALACSAGQYPLGTLWTNARELLLGAVPPLGLTLDSQVGAVEKATGLDVRGGLLDWIGPQAVRFSRLSGPEGRQRVNTTFLFHMRQPRRVHTGLVTLLGALSQRFGAFYIEEDRAGDWPVIRFYLGNPASAGGVGRRPTALVCLADPWLVAGASAGDMAEVLKRIKTGGGDSIADQAGFKAVMERLPAERLSEGYVNLAAIHALIGSMGATGRDWLPLDLRALPQAALAGQALGTAGYATRIAEDQLHISAMILYP